MKTVMWRMRISAEEMAQWKREAESEGIAVAAWVRKRCGGERRQQAVAAAGSGLPERVTPPKPSGAFVQGEVQESVAIDFLPMPSPGICANCEHKKSKHGGFGTCCQHDNCQCPKFE